MLDFCGRRAISGIREWKREALLLWKREGGSLLQFWKGVEKGGTEERRGGMASAEENGRVEREKVIETKTGSTIFAVRVERVLFRGIWLMGNMEEGDEVCTFWIWWKISWVRL